MQRSFAGVGFTEFLLRTALFFCVSPSFPRLPPAYHGTFRAGTLPTRVEVGPQGICDGGGAAAAAAAIRTCLRTYLSGYFAGRSGEPTNPLPACPFFDVDGYAFTHLRIVLAVSPLPALSPQTPPAQRPVQLA